MTKFHCYILEDIEYPKRSYLYNFPPEGLGTEMVESPLSYCVRLSKAHHISSGDFVRYLIFPELDRNYLRSNVNSNVGLDHIELRVFLGIGEFTLDLIRILTHLTMRNDLEQLTFLKLKKFLSANQLLNKYKSWCPECLLDMKTKNDVLYEPIIWSIQEYKHCHIHKVNLLRSCPNPACQKQLKLIGNKEIIGICHYCGAFLGSTEIQNRVEINENEILKSIYISNFLNFYFSPTGFTPDDLFIPEMILNLIKNNFSGNVSIFCKEFRLNRSTIDFWAKRNYKIKLDTFINICMRSGIFPSEMLEKRGNILFGATKDIPNFTFR